ncbi:hypothetical protein LCH21_04075 [Patescibacteria group bacterium]|nr:hypothetical protein [Patescibacteria group bacterium]
MTHTYPIPNTSAAIQAARDALDNTLDAFDNALDAFDAIEPAVQQDIRDIVASLIEAGDIPAARRAVIEAAATASSDSDVDNIVAAQEKIRDAAQTAPAPALAAEPAPAVVRETVVVHDDPTPDVAPFAAPAATGTDKVDEILKLLRGDQGLIARSTQHGNTLYGEDGQSGLVKDVAELKTDVDSLMRSGIGGDQFNWEGLWKNLRDNFGRKRHIH